MIVVILLLIFYSKMSAVWNFFSKKGNNQPASCNLCCKIYKTCGNTTNLASHLKTKHYNAYLKFVQMQSSKTKTVESGNKEDEYIKDNILQNNNADPDAEVIQSSNGNSLQKLTVPDESSNGADNQSNIQETKKRKQSTSNIQETKKPKQSTLISCFERGSNFEEGGQKHTEVTQALIYMICKDNLPLSCVEKSGLKNFIRTVHPLYKLPSRKKVTRLVESRYNTTKSIIIKTLEEVSFLCFTSDILTITNSTRSFLVLTVHFIDNQKGKNPAIQSINLCALKLSQSHTAQYIKECWDDICEEFVIAKSKILSITTDGGANMVAAVRLFLGDNHRIPCMAHSLNLIVDAVLKDIPAFSGLCDHVKSIVTFFKQSVNASDQLRAEQQESGKKEGEVLTLTQSVSTRWNSCLDMLERFLKLSALVAKILATKSQFNKHTPDMIASSQLHILRDLIVLLRPFKEATEEISGEKYVTSSLAIPIWSLLRQVMDQSTPLTSLGDTVRKALLEKINEKLVPFEKNTFLSAATILDPRFKRLHFTSPVAVSNAIAKISNDIRSEHRRRGQRSPEPRPVQETPDTGELSIWCSHEKLINRSMNRAEIPSSGSVPNELKQYLDQPHLERKSDPIEFWVNCRHFTPVLSEIALKYLICPATSVSSERLASAINLAVPDCRSRLTGEHIKERVLLMSISDEYWFD